EAHGTGTALGDPTEAGALAAVYGSAGRATPLSVGAAKANVGHSEAASGQVGLLKVQQLIGQRASMGNAHLRVLNPLVGQRFGASAACFVLPLERGRSLTEGVAGVSSFGFSGTIAHALMQRAEDGSSGAASGLMQPVPQLAFRRSAFTWRESAHPFIQQRIASSQEGVLFRSPLVGAVHALVADHVVQGRVIFPGAGYLELARAASGSSALQAVFFLQPLALESAGSYIECSVTAGSFEIRTGSMLEIAVHCTGSFASSGVPAGVSRMSLAALHSHVGSRVVDVGALYDAFDK
ncbi:type i fatty acid, partial [Chrysochromulina tobinii]